MEQCRLKRPGSLQRIHYRFRIGFGKRGVLSGTCGCTARQGTGRQGWVWPRSNVSILTAARRTADAASGDCLEPGDARCLFLRDEPSRSMKYMWIGERNDLRYGRIMQRRKQEFLAAQSAQAAQEGDCRYRNKRMQGIEV
jgi:hypothetical protein